MCVHGVYIAWPGARRCSGAGPSRTRCAALNPGATLTLEELTAHLSGRLARFKHPRELRLVDELPGNVTG